MNIYQKMLAATAEINTVAKNLQVDTGKGKGYKAVGEADVLAAVKPIEIKHGIYSYPLSRNIVDSGEIVNQTQYGERKSIFLRVETIYRFVNTDEPTEFIDITAYGDGVDSQDKAPGKAMTYADKYALLKAYKIQTGDDPDADASGDLVSRTRKKPEPKLEDPTDHEAGQLERRVFQDACEAHGLNAVEVLGNVGWKGGKMTFGQYRDAMKWIDANG